SPSPITGAPTKAKPPYLTSSSETPSRAASRSNRMAAPVRRHAPIWTSAVSSAGAKNGFETFEATQAIAASRRSHTHSAGTRGGGEGRGETEDRRRADEDADRHRCRAAPGRELIAAELAPRAADLLAKGGELGSQAALRSWASPLGMRRARPRRSLRAGGATP